MATVIATLLGLVVILGLSGLAFLTLFALWRQRRREGAARVEHSHAVLVGAQPVSLHPKVDLGRCIGSGTCVEVCPEKDVLAVLDGKAQIVNPTACIGHGECLRACPVDAIALVLGSERRGVEIPLVSREFETNVPGLYVVGELGGMGLIYNATVQALQAMSAIGKNPPPVTPGVLQVLIVGAGPAGLAASLKGKQLGLACETVDQETVGGTILQYPRQKIAMTRPVELPLYGRLWMSEVSKEALLETWNGILAKTQLEVRSGVKVEGIVRRSDGVFDVATSAGPIRAHRVVLALGRRGSPRKLGIPGEELAKVTYRLLEPERYTGNRVLVVGGGDSAVEAAIALGQAKAKVTLSYRGTAFDRIKKKNQERLDAAVALGRIELLLGSAPIEIAEREVIVDVSGMRSAIANDYVMVFAGGVLPTKFLEAAGVQVATFKGEAYAPAN
ncbi:MAG: NAD(P)-binding domain-containing protein [Myxococcota bacterium]